MNLEQLITDAYAKHQAQIEAQLKAKLVEEQKRTQIVIDNFQKGFDAAVSPEMQALIGIKITGDINQAQADFEYKNTRFTIYAHGSEWRVLCVAITGKANDFCVSSNDLSNSLLVAMGEIRTNTESEIDRKEVEKIRATLNRCCSEIKAISGSEIWQQICQKSGNAEAAETFLEDAICLLGDAISCVDEAVE